MKLRLLLMLLSGTLSVRAAYDWSRYEIIAERAPFGKEPLPEEPAAPVRPAGEFAKQYRLCMLYADAQGKLKAGLVSKTNNKNFFLQVGESDDNLQLIDVKLEAGIAIVQKGNETAQMILEGLAAPAAPVQPAAAVASIVPANILQQVRRIGAESAPAHILAALTDSQPKRPSLSLRRTQAVAGTAGSSISEETSDKTQSDYSGRSGSGVATGAAQTVAMAKPRPANYLIQSVPERFNPF